MDMELSEKKCKPCEGGVAPLDQQEVARYKKHIKDDWEVTDNKRISREFLFKNYKHAIEFVNKVADLAEEEGHHPVMHVYYGRVIIEFWTHAINGLSENDFIMASKIDKF
jgi:4a-hydroxytetrahydrobiopterin dehydratase